MVLGALMATTYTKMRPVLDAAGQQVFWESGRPRYEVDQWASFWNGWPSNVPIILALVFFLMAAVKLASGMWRSRRRSPLPHSRQESRDSL
ncbi:MAG: hypothetical protein EOP85_14640 [Verrucomicrobiaceae bacterium]|nr:MAG: hypothetical protein EOP85_14640 [Verrucomicrobiaceae bacterium]